MRPVRQSELLGKAMLYMRLPVMIVAGVFVLFVASPAAALASTPTAYTSQELPTGATTEEVSGEVDPAGQTTKYEFAYSPASSEWCTSEGISGSPADSTPAQTLAFTDETFHGVSVQVSSLTAGTEYCEEVVAKNGSGTAHGGQGRFTAGVPEVFSSGATPTGATTEAIGGQVDPAGQTTSYHDAYGLATSEWCTSNGSSGSAEHSTSTQTVGFTDAGFHDVSVALSGLSAGSQYCEELVAANGSGTAQGGNETFTAGVPVVSSFEGTPTGATTETIEGQINPVGQTTEYHVAYGLASSTWCTSNGSSGSAEHSTPAQTLSFTDVASHEVSGALTGLTAGTAYCAAFVAANASGTGRADQVHFTAGVPEVFSSGATPTGATTEAIGGQINPAGQTTSYHDAYGLATSEWCTSNGSSGSAEHSTPAETLGFTDAVYHVVTIELTGLTAGTEYCQELVAANASGTAQNGQGRFTAGVPVISTFEPTPTGATTEAIGGQINPAGQTTSYHDAYGLATSEWCTSNGSSGSPEHSTSTQTLGFTDATFHEVSISLSELIAGTEYCEELGATNGSGTAQSYQVTFTVGVPLVFTNAFRSTGATTAEVSGEVDPAGQTTQYHVEYGLASSIWCRSGGDSGSAEHSSPPETLGFADGTSHEVTVSLSGLTAATEYCAELVATNGSGTVRGGQVTVTAGVPEVFLAEATSTGATTETITGQVDPSGQTTEYNVAYGLASSTWCASNGSSGSAEHSTPAETLGFTDGTAHEVSVPLNGLTAATEYCAELVATNGSGTAGGGHLTFTTELASGGSPGGGSGGSSPGGGTSGGGSTTSPSTGTTPANTPPAATGSVSLAGSTITVQSSGATAIKLTCAGTATCSGEITLTAKSTTKRGKKKHTKTETIETATFSIPADETATIKPTLSSTGKALLKAAHGHLSATLTILKASPSPSATLTKTVNLVLQKQTKRKRSKK
jgi:hypothetical protein